MVEMKEEPKKKKDPVTKQLRRMLGSIRNIDKGAKGDGRHPKKQCFVHHL